LAQVSPFVSESVLNHLFLLEPGKSLTIIAAMADLENPREPLNQERRQSQQIPSIKDATIDIRMGFVRKVYGVLTAQLILTVAVAAPIQTFSMAWINDHIWLLYLSSAITLSTMCAMACCQDIVKTYPQNYIVLFTFTVFEGVLVGFISAAFTWQSVVLAAGVTVLIFLAMTLYAWNTKTDFTGLGPYIFAATMVFFMFGLVISMMRFAGLEIDWLILLYDIGGVLLFTFYIVLGTQKILGEWGGHKEQFGIDDYVWASLNLYLDIINLFFHVLKLVGQRRERS